MISLLLPMPSEDSSVFFLGSPEDGAASYFDATESLLIYAR
jgi:hypothetical protein